MDKQEFVTQIDRLKNTYGDKQYPEERVKVIWSEVKDRASAWLERQVSHWIASSRMAPLLPEIRDAMSLEREHMHSKDKQRYSREARETFTLWASGESGVIFQTIIKRIQGQVLDSDWDAFMSGLNNLVRSAR